MFPSSTLPSAIETETKLRKSAKNKAIPNIYNTYMPVSNYADAAEHNIKSIDQMLENEIQHNKSDNWNKLDKTAKIQRLTAFADSYGKTNGLTTKDIKGLRLFFVDCLNKNKLQKAKDLVYDKETGEIISIPSLFFNTINQSYTLRITDIKRVSTLKSLTPKRVVPLSLLLKIDDATKPEDTNTVFTIIETELTL